MNNSNRYYVLVVLSGILVLTLILSTISLNIDIALGQELSGSIDRQLNVAFNSMKINNDHDPLFPGEWKIDTYVNGQRTQLWIGSELDRVNTGQTVTFSRNDVIGIVAKEYNAKNNFGIGRHDECSQSVGEAGDLYDEVDTSCDFRLRYTITE